MIQKKIIGVAAFNLLSACFTLIAQDAQTASPATKTIPEPRKEYGMYDSGAGFSLGFYHYPDLDASYDAGFFLSALRVGGYFGGLYRFGGNWGVGGHLGIYAFYVNEKSKNSHFFTFDIPLRAGVSYFWQDWRFEFLLGFYAHTYNFAYFSGAAEIAVKLCYQRFAVQISCLFSEFPADIFPGVAKKSIAYGRLEFIFLLN